MIDLGSLVVVWFHFRRIRHEVKRRTHKLSARVGVVGAGNVGATTALFAAFRDIADVVLVDVVEGLAKGKALDLMQAAPKSSRS